MCIFKGKVIYALYTDASILAGPYSTEIDNILKLMRKANLDITEEGTLEDFIGVNIDIKPNGIIHLTQPHLIHNILGNLNLLGEGTTNKTTTASPSKILK